ncbi:alpha/beta fold hydrolase [Acidisoma cellulosilytica]|uniref:Alpha/beta fold hydrolase n=1 Tax=Acidisoma cellulosilyticum TaxID=2802395 RepID=A0A963YZ56_9PROT|nr:alpha/beta fold hydrolase [Acidisoma cellulosilyticum]MCB8879549.1 alpha/beta fold hydrolase [Acidisoma cellulosilyticum]
MRDRAAAPEGFAHHFETVRGLRLHYVAGGDDRAAPLVLIAGYPESWYAWRRVMPLLAGRFRVIAIDLPGQGDSDKPADGYDTGTIAEILHDLLRQIGLSRNGYGLVAHDVGAWVAFPYALRFSSEVTRLVLMDAGIPGVTLPDSLPTAPDRAWRTWHFPFHAIPDLPELLIAGRERVYLDWFLRRKAVDPFSFSETDLDEYERIFTQPGALRAGLAFYRAASLSAVQNHALAAQGKLPMPVLALSADQGSIPDMAEPLRPYAADISGARLTRCGHFLPEEQPQAVVDHLLRFFG